jgi:hypothetical protein
MSNNDDGDNDDGNDDTPPILTERQQEELRALRDQWGDRSLAPGTGEIWRIAVTRDRTRNHLSPPRGGGLTLTRHDSA